MAFFANPPWLLPGIMVSHQTGRAGLVEAGLHWHVSKSPLYCTYNHRQRPVKDYAALLRDSDGRVLTIVSDTWQPVQNEDALAYFEKFCKVANAKVTELSTLRDGELMWVNATVSDVWEKSISDLPIIYSWLLTNVYEYGINLNIRGMIYMPTLGATFVSPLSRVRLNQDVNVLAKNIMPRMNTVVHNFRDSIKTLLDVTYSSNQSQEYYAAVFEAAKNDVRPVQVAQQHLADMPRQGSWFSVYGSLVYVIDHVLGYSPDTRLQSAWYGINAKRKIRGLELAVNGALQNRRRAERA